MAATETGNDSAAGQGAPRANAASAHPRAGSSSAASDAAASADAASETAGAPASATAGGAAAGPPAGEGGTGRGPHAAASEPGPGAARGCGDAKLLFCDDFEGMSATPGMPPSAPAWSIVKNGMGSVVIDAEVPAHSGRSSVKVDSTGGYQTFFALTGAHVLPAQGAIYLRVFIRLGAPMSAGHNTYYKAGASGSASSEHETRIGVMNEMLMINQPAGDRGFLSNEEYYRDGNQPGVVFAPMQWTCVETFFDPAHSTIDIWVDGDEVPDLHRTDWEQDAIGALHFGFEKYAGPDATIWYDDIAVSEQPIGCR